MGDPHVAARPPSSEQVVLVIVPLVVHENDAFVEVVEFGGVLVSVTVGAAEPPVVIVHEALALAFPPGPEMVTENLCPPAASPV